MLALVVPSSGLSLGPAVEKPQKHEPTVEDVMAQKRQARAERDERKRQQAEEKRLEQERKLAEHKEFVERQKERAHKRIEEKKQREMQPYLDHKAFVERQKERAHKRLAEKKEMEAREQKRVEESEGEALQKVEQEQEEARRKAEADEKKRIWAEKHAQKQKEKEEKDAVEKAKLEEQERLEAEEQERLRQEKMKEEWETQHKRDLEVKEREMAELKHKQEVLDKTLAESRAVCDKIAHVRPQRTAGATLGEVIMPKMIAANNQSQINKYHMEMRWAKATAPNCMVASLRDPVERFMSEYSMFKENSGTLEMDEWDFHTNDMPWVRQMKSRSLADGIEEYMSSPANPTFNRQARYLLGFERVACSERCCGICSHGNPGYPAYEYNFTANHEELLAKAKEALKSMRAFTIAECFPESMRAVALSVGWNPDEAEEMARQTKVGVRRNTAGLTDVSVGLGNTDLLGRIKSGAAGGDSMPWSAVLPQGMAEKIREKNMVDAELLEYAKKLLFERHGITC